MRGLTTSSLREAPSYNPRAMASLVLILSLLSSSAATTVVAPEAEIRAILAAQAEAWTRGDLESFVRPYAEDASFLTPGGAVRGRDEVLRRYRARYPDAAAMGTLDLTVERVVVLGPDAVTVEARWRLTWAAALGKEPASGLTLIVFRRAGSGWEIVQDASL